MSTNLNGHEIPVNKMAAMSFAKGSQHTQRVPHWYLINHAPPGTKPFPGPKEFDLTGKKVSRLSIIGYHGNNQKRRKSLWVVRCVCGNYEIRTGDKLRKAINGKLKTNVHRCMVCTNQANSRRHYDYHTLGYDKHENLDSY